MRLPCAPFFFYAVFTAIELGLLLHPWGVGGPSPPCDCLFPRTKKISALPDVNTAYFFHTGQPKKGCLAGAESLQEGNSDVAKRGPAYPPCALLARPGL